MKNLPLGQLFVFGFNGTKLPDEARELLVKDRASGCILFSRNIENLEQVVEINTEIINAAGTEMPALISVDQEGGPVQRLRNICTRIPPMEELAQLCEKDPTLCYKTGALMGRELVSLGFHVDYAPVLDINTNSKNPIIGIRSFHSQSEKVAELGAQFIRGLQGSGIAACGKHFPGHGDTTVDSHLDLPVIQHDLARLKKIEFVPFRAAIKAGVEMMMTAHILAPKIDAGYPATLSRVFLHDYLRTELSFDGIIVSDDIEMKAVADRYDVPEIIELGLRAGVDLFLVCQDTGKMAVALETAHKLVENGVISRSQIEQSLQRIQKLKAKYIGETFAPSIRQAQQIVKSSPHQILAIKEAKY